MGVWDHGVGSGIDGLRRRARASLVTLATVSLVVAVAVPAMAAGKQSITVVKGDDYRMADAKMADKVTRYGDPAGDQLQLDGSPAPDAPPWSDIEAVYVARTRTPPKLQTKMTSDYPRGSAGAFYGKREQGYREPVVFVAVKMAKRLPGSSLGQQVEIGFSGDAAVPVQHGTDTITWAGTERFTLSGLFSDGAYAVGATDVSGREPGLELEAGDYYNARSGAFGFYRSKNSTWYVVVPRADDTQAITVSVRSSTPDGSVIDRLDLPGGGHFIDLGDPTGGYKPKAELPPLSCRALETFNGQSGTIEGLGIDANLVRYTVGLEPTADPAVAAKLLGPALITAGPVEVALSVPGSDEAPLVVPGQLADAEEGNAVRLTFEAPEGQWTFELVGESALKTPAGERIIDHSSLTGPAGVRVGPGLDGFVAGNRVCAPSAAAEDAAAEAAGAAEAEAAAGDDETASEAEGDGADATEAGTDG